MSGAPAEIIELVDKFERNIEAYKNTSYKEEQLKQEFINPLFKALGWDVDNVSGAAPQYRDVIFEDSIKIAGGTRAPDYCFTLAGRKMFFVEAKKPSVNIGKDIKPSYQLRRYAWSAKLPLSILTDFEELAVYDSRSRPKKTDRASTGRIKYLNYKDYVEQWDYLYNIFSKDAVLQGSFDKYAESTKKKRGTTEVDDEFLSEIENWRELFARNIALRNPELTVEELNYAVQQTIDRIIFLRMCEDRGIEKYEKLRSLMNNDNIYEKFGEFCRDADAKYNSGLFHFKQEKGRPTEPDELSLNLHIDNGVFKTILKSLYYPESPYEFSVLPPEILGNVYEQFLGKVIRLTKGHQAKVEEKPEVKKAGGVFYTPEYIVDYIVEDTIGKLCKDKTPNKVSKLKILDSACGSGSFLLGAYKYLLQWHRTYYSKQKDKKRLKDKIYKGKNGEWHLTIQEKKRILLNNIYGVDIDAQAVGVTKLSLLLEVLEGENRDALEAQQKLFKERALPDLGSNIKCGNTLIGSEIFNDHNLELTGEDIKRINPFNWESEFPDIFAMGGFDAVIGNPPYIRIQAMKEWAPKEVEFYKENYQSASKGNYDIYVVFVEKGLELLNENGLLGYILPHKFFNAKYGQQLRSIIAEGKNLNKVVHFGDQQVFEKATTYTCLLFLNKSQMKKFNFAKVDDLLNWRISGEAIEGEVPAKKVTDDEWNFIVGKDSFLFDKLNTMPLKLENVAHLFVGLQTSADKVYIMTLEKENGLESRLFSRALDESVELETNLIHPLLKGSEISRYKQPKYNFKVLFPYYLDSGNVIPLTENELRLKSQKTYDYLIKNKSTLIKRSKTDSTNWWLYPYPKNLSLFETPKILCQVLSPRGNFTLDLDGEFYFVGGGTAGGYALKVKNDNPLKLKFLLGILNSKITTYYVSKIASGFKGNFFAFGKSSLKSLPMPNLEQVDPKNHHQDLIIKLVEHMLKLNKDIETARTPQDKELIQRQIDATDKQIDALVYELYGLSEDEIRIIEGD
ncbi:MAG: Eco57I restriction-modification methylase domain-containing protein [Methanobacterium sp.]|nr:Eco57I restriction-modification methylase domain-containing protein [Methanobacterium sp.]